MRTNIVEIRKLRDHRTLDTISLLASLDRRIQRIEIIDTQTKQRTEDNQESIPMYSAINTTYSNLHHSTIEKLVENGQWPTSSDGLQNQYYDMMG